MYAVKFFFTFYICGLTLLAGEADEWVKRLGAADYADREAAVRRLWEMGPPALGAVEQAVSDPDPEIRKRAKEVWRFLSKGVSPHWPVEIQQEVLQNDGLSQDAFRDLVNRIVELDEISALPFLIMQLRGPHSNPAEERLKKSLDNADTARRFKEFFPIPSLNLKETNLLFRACRSTGEVDDLKRAMDLPFLEKHHRKTLIKDGGGILLDLHKIRNHKALLPLARSFSRHMPDTALFMYFEAYALTHTGKVEEAKILNEEAQNLHPGDEEIHVLTAETMYKMGLRKDCVQEWRQVLNIAPDNGIHDVTASFQMASFYEIIKDYAKAADHLEHARKLIRDLNSRGLSGSFETGTAGQLSQHIRNLRMMENQLIRDQDAVKMDFAAEVKGGRVDELRVLSEDAGFQMNLVVKPYGLRLLEVFPSHLIYDPEKKHLLLMIDGEAFGEPVPYGWEEGLKNERHLVQVKTLDMRYFFELDPRTLKGELIDRFELDYTCMITFNAQMKSLKTPLFTLDEWIYNFKEFEKGIPMDVLPESSRVIVTGAYANNFEVQALIQLPANKEPPDYL